METKQKRTKVVASVLVLAGLLVFALTAIGGNLEPKAPPGPTMKTLDEVEPRIPVQSLGGSASAKYVIKQPGSYYFTGNIIAEPNKNCITIAANNVTLDLMGFAITGVAGSGDGIKITGGDPLPMEEISFSVVIRNGTICNLGGNGIEFVYSFFDVWPTYLQLEKLSVNNNGGNGVNAYNAYLTIEGIDAHKNDGHGLCVDGNSCCHMEDVSFTYNGGDGMHILGMMTNVDAYSGYASHNGGNGMYVKVDGEASIHMEDMSLTRNDANGLVVDGNSFCHMEDVSFTYNTGHGVFVYGMLDAFGVLAPHNGGGGIIVNGSGNLNQCTVVGNGGSGIEVGTGSTVRNCTARGNTGDGIVVSSNCRVVGNTCESNGVGAIGATNPAGIRATGGANRIEANHVIGNNVGIDIGAAGNLIIKNSATGNTTNYDIASGNTAGPTLGTGDIVSDNPHANYEF